MALSGMPLLLLLLSKAINPLVKEFIAYSGLSSEVEVRHASTITKAAVSLSVLTRLLGERSLD